jgi:hypothetical protein
MKDLQPNEQEIAARVFHHLVTPSGTKIAHTAPDLAEYAKLPQEPLEPLLERLASGAGGRLLRSVAPPLDQPMARRYEIFHDVLAPAILNWHRRYMERRTQEEIRREEQERQKRLQEQTEREHALTQARRLRWGVIGLSFMLLAMIALAGFAFQQRNAANQQRDVAERAQEEAIRAKEDEVAQRQKAENALEVLKSIDSAAKSTSDSVKAKDFTKLPLRIYIHIRDEQQRQRAKQIEKELEGKGFVVPGIERVVKGPPKNQLRYFRESEANKAKANEIVEILRSLKVDAVPAYISGYEYSTVIGLGYYEIWFTPDALK